MFRIPNLFSIIYKDFITINCPNFLVVKFKHITHGSLFSTLWSELQSPGHPGIGKNHFPLSSSAESL